MKISRLFHWLYAFLLTLPLVSSLWLGLIWTFNENAQVPIITENVSKEVTFSQLIKNGDFKSAQYWDFNNISYLLNGNNGVDIETTNSGLSYSLQSTDDINLSDTYCFVFTLSNVVDNFSYRIRWPYETNWTTASNGTFYLTGVPVSTSTIGIQFSSSSLIDFTLSNVMFINLTELEMSSSDFSAYFTENYYDYTISSHVVVDNYSTRETLDNPINYIWLPSFGGMGWTIQNVMNYLVGNLFGIVVSSGIGLAIVKLLTYWLCISLIWLVFDVIMYVPLLIHRYLDKGVLD